MKVVVKWVVINCFNFVYLSVDVIVNKLNLSGCGEVLDFIVDLLIIVDIVVMLYEVKE